MSTDATLALLRQALANAGNPAELAKNATFTQPTQPTIGLQTYNLEAPAKNLYPVLSPIRNKMPRVKATGGVQANWKAVTGINTAFVGVGVGEGQRGGVQSVSTAEFFAAFRTIGIESSVTEEADLSAEGYDDLRARAANSNLQALMIEEERIIVGGFSSVGLGTTGTPTLTTSVTGGAIAATTVVSGNCVALTMDGVRNSNTIQAPNVVPATITRNNADGTTTTYNAGAAQRSVASNITTGAGGANSVTASVPAKQGAAGYAWFVGPVGAEAFYGITNYSQVVITSIPTNASLSTALTADYSKNGTVFDGLIALNANPSSNAYWHAMTPGTGLTADGYGGIVEFENVLRWYYDTLRGTPSKIWVASQEMQTIRTKFLAGNGSQPSRFVFQIQQGTIQGGGIPKGYLNMFAGAAGGNSEIPLEVHPYLPAGTVIFEMETIPYPQNNINNVKQILSRKDYHQREWPQITRSYQYGVYSDEVLQHYFPVSIAVISNIAPV
jgi:hypothetical protein